VTRALLALAAGALLVSGCGGGGGGPSARAATSPGSRVVVVMMENKDYGQVIGSSDAPSVNDLARRSATPQRFYGVRHPSLPNYLAVIGGSTFGIHTDCTACHLPATTLIDQLARAGVSWKAYMGGMPRSCYGGAFHDRYAKKHNPFAYFDRIMRRPSRCRRVVPGTQLDKDLAAGTLPQFVFLVPDLCNDTHDCPVSHGDDYLKHRLPPLLDNLGPNGFLVLAWEEGSASSNAGCCGTARGGHVPVVIAGPNVRPGGRPVTPYSHYSTLRTIEDAFGLAHLRTAGARSTRSLAGVFESRPRLRP
jgi:hypothetical protein